MMQAIILVLAYALMLAGPLLQGLAGNANPNAYIFAPVMLAGVIPQIAGQNIRPSPLTMVLAILICGGVAMGLWVRQHVNEVLCYRLMYGFLGLNGRKLRGDAGRGFLG